MRYEYEHKYVVVSLQGYVGREAHVNVENVSRGLGSTCAASQIRPVVEEPHHGNVHHRTSHLQHTRTRLRKPTSYHTTSKRISRLLSTLTGLPPPLDAPTHPVITVTVAESTRNGHVTEPQKQ